MPGEPDSRTGGPADPAGAADAAILICCPPIGLPQIVPFLTASSIQAMTSSSI
jgi:hypothetical protein